MSPFEKTQEQRRGIRKTVLMLVAIVSAVMALAAYKVLRPQAMSVEQLQTHNAFLFATPRAFNDFSLIDHNNAAFTRQQLQEKWSLVYFGFTHCPHICPTALTEIKRTLENLPPAMRDKSQVVLVTLDPARDTPATLQQYVNAFDADFIGVTGEFLDIRRFANEVNIAFVKTPLADDYTVDHSTHLVLINPKGDYHAFFRPPFTNDTLGVSLPEIMNRW